MIDIYQTISLAQIGFALSVIALAVVYYVFYKKPTNSRKK